MKEDRFFHAGAWPLTCICTVFENRSKKSHFTLCENVKKIRKNFEGSVEKN